MVQLNHQAMSSINLLNKVRAKIGDSLTVFNLKGKMTFDKTSKI